MAMKYLGETLDIHAGGFDHLPVHHPNEIAQTEALTGKPLANLWLHSNFITVEHQKLSKSLGNSFTLHDIVAKGFEPLALRLLFLQSHYRTEADFSWDSLAAAVSRLQGLRAMAELQWQGNEKAPQVDFIAYQQAILANLQDDLSSPRALAKLSELEQQLQTNGLAAGQQTAFGHFLQYIDQLFGLELSTISDLSDVQKAVIAEREAARQAKDFKQADEFRTILAQQGIGVRDTPNGAIWFRL
jgi:cysteinyl-tRNA synthetase